MKKTLIYVALITALCSILVLILSTLPKSKEREAIIITNASGKTASKYQNFDDVIKNQDPENNGMPTTILGSDTSVAQGSENELFAFCGNKNSKIYHKSGCSSAKKTKEENKVYFKTLEECQNAGYKPCKICSE